MSSTRLPTQVPVFAGWLDTVEALGVPAPAQVYDVGGHIGDFAEVCAERFPLACVFSFEPQPDYATAGRARANGRWRVTEAALGSQVELRTLRVNTFEPSASSFLTTGPVRAALGLEDRFELRQVKVETLDMHRTGIAPAWLKVDVEGFELQVLRGAVDTLADCVALIVEVNLRPDIFLGSPSTDDLTEFLYPHGWYMDRVLDTFGGLQQNQLWLPL